MSVPRDSTAKLVEGSFDLAISNVSFGDYKLRGPRFDEPDFLIHNTSSRRVCRKSGRRICGVHHLRREHWARQIRDYGTACRTRPISSGLDGCRRPRFKLLPWIFGSRQLSARCSYRESVNPVFHSPPRRRHLGHSRFDHRLRPWTPTWFARSHLGCRRGDPVNHLRSVAVARCVARRGQGSGRLSFSYRYDAALRARAARRSF